MRIRSFLAWTFIASFAHASPTLHEPIPSNPKEDIEKRVSLIGDLPSAIETRSGAVNAPDPTRPVESTPHPISTGSDTFHADRDTRRPDLLPYEEVFVPSTAPFKRLNAYDAVDANYTLFISTPELVPMHGGYRPLPTDDRFFADFSVDLDSRKAVKIPSVASGQHIVSARAGTGAVDVPVTFYRDIAENWFVRGTTSGRIRIVMEVAAPRNAFAGYGDPDTLTLPRLSELPAAVRPSAEVVAKKIGVARTMRPAEIVPKLVAYFRDFTDTEGALPASNNIYLDLALSQKGVCRHRAFAFMITALYLGIPTRVVTNEAHAWVEVYDGTLFRRIDLGGAGRMLTDALSTNTRYTPPRDSFAWPEKATRGEDLAPRPASPLASAIPASSLPHSPPEASVSADLHSENAESTNKLPASRVEISRADATARRHQAVLIEGSVASANGPMCAHLSVDLFLKRPHGGQILLGSTATNERGTFSASLVVPSRIPLGDYEVYARTSGDTHCGGGASK